MVEPTRYEENLFPSELVEQTRASKRAFELATGGDPLLLIRLDDPLGELAWGLASALPTTVRMPARPAGALSQPGMRAGRLGLPDHGSVPPPSRRGLTSARLLGMMVHAPHFVVCLRKRPDSQTASPDRITVGRARNNDIVLRHDTVSKFHAWFERGPGPVYQVGDAGSRNGTTINGVTLPPTQRTTLEPGDQIRFGQVEITLSTASALWEALAAARAMASR